MADFHAVMEEGGTGDPSPGIEMSQPVEGILVYFPSRRRLSNPAHEELLDGYVDPAATVRFGISPWVVARLLSKITTFQGLTGLYVFLFGLMINARGIRTPAIVLAAGQFGAEPFALDPSKRSHR